MTNPDGGKTIQFAHNVAFLNLCVPTGEPIVLAQPTKTALEGALDRPDREFRDLMIILEYIATNVNMFYDGTPECSGHQLPF